MQFDNPRDHLIELENRLNDTEEQLHQLTRHVLTLEEIMTAIAEAVLPAEEFEELQKSDETQE